MNRNRFITSQPIFNNDINMYHTNFRSPVPRYTVWPQTPPINHTTPIPFNATVTQPKNTCDLWTVEPYDSHQASPAHQAKKAVHQRTVNPNYINLTNHAISNSNNNINVNNSSSVSTILPKRNYKKRARRNRNSQSKKSDESTESTKQNSSLRVTNEQIATCDEKRKQSMSCDDEKTDLSPNTDGKSIDKMSSASTTIATSTTQNIIRGQEMLIPVSGVFCALCEIFFPEKEVAENVHCSSRSHCDAYEKLLKKIRGSKCGKRRHNDDAMNEDDDEDDIVESAKRWKTTENKDRDFRSLALENDMRFYSKTGQLAATVETSNANAPAPTAKVGGSIAGTNGDSDEADRASTSEFVAPDFSLEFPDEDYDETESVSMDNREILSQKTLEVNVNPNDL